VGGAAQSLAQLLTIPVRTLDRWRAWWSRDFRRTPFWQSRRARFAAPVSLEELPQCPLERFEADTASQRVQSMLRFLAPLSKPAVIR
jgi:hypothetical protein